MTQLHVNNFSTTIANTVGIADTLIQLASTSGLPALAGGDFILLTLYRQAGIVESGHEVVKVTSWVGNQITVVRAFEGAAATQFNVGDKVQARATATSFSLKQDKEATIIAIAGVQANIDANALLAVMTRATALSTNTTDFNTVTTPGTHKVDGNGTWTGSSNGPTSAAAYGQLVVTVNGNVVQQEYTAHIGGRTYKRLKYNASDWQAWVGLWDSGSLTNLSQLVNGPGFLSGTVGIANGGTGATTASAALVNLGIGSVENKSSATIRSELTATNVQNALAGSLSLEKAGFPQLILWDNDAGVDLGRWAMWVQQGGSTLSLGKQVDNGVGTPALSMDRAGNTYAAAGMYATAYVAAAINGYRHKQGSDATGYGVIHRNDGTDFYLMTTNVNDADGNYNGLRPFRFNLATGNVTMDHNVSINGTTTVQNLVVNGTTTTVNSTTVTLDDPLLTLGGDTAPTVDDGKDRGIEFQWHNGTVAKKGYFGFDRSTQRMVYIPDATNNAEVISGSVGTVEANLLGNVTGSLTGNAQTATTAGGSTNLLGGTAGQIHVQTGPGTSGFSAAGTAGQVMLSGGTGVPTWINQNALTFQSSQITNALGFTPLQQGGGTNQLNNKLYIGWSAGNKMRVQVDTTDYGTVWPIDVAGNAATATTAGNVSGVVAVANGGTGATTAAAALANLGAIAKVGDTFTGSRPITVATDTGIVRLKGNAGGWAMGMQFRGSSDTDFGGYWAYGTADVGELWSIGPLYNSGYLTVHKSGRTVLGRITDNGTDRLQVEGSIHVANGSLMVVKPDFPQVVLWDSDAGANSGRWGAWVNQGGSTLAIGPQTDGGVGTQGLTVDRSGNVVATTRMTAPTYTAQAWDGIRHKQTSASTGYGVIFRNDGTDYYIITTNNNDADGNFNSLRPFRFNLASGDVTMQHNVTVGGTMHVNGLAGVGRWASFNTTGTQRWSLGAGTQAETGSGVGSDFQINRYNDAGVYQDSPLFINRSNGDTSFSKNVYCNAALTANGTVVRSGAAGTTRQFLISTNGSGRWAIGSDGAAEGGSDTGSNFFLNRFNDTGNFIGTSVAINRSTGAMGLSGDVTAYNNFTVTGTTTLTGVRETRVAMAANNIDTVTGSVFTKTISGATTLTVSNAPAAGTVAAFILELTNGGSATVTWWSGIKWEGGTVPTLTASGKDILGFYTHDGGTTWAGKMMQKDSK